MVWSVPLLSVLLCSVQVAGGVFAREAEDEDSDRSQFKGLQLEEELHLLTPSNAFDDLEDIDQQREQPSEDDATTMTGTTSLPTQQDTSVEEPIEKPLSAPTPESAAVRTVAFELQTRNPSVKPKPSFNKDGSAEEQLLTVKKKQDEEKRIDDNSEEVLLTIDSESNEDDSTSEMDVPSHAEEVSTKHHLPANVLAAPSNYSSEVTRHRLMQVLEESGLFTRTARKANRQHPPVDEDLLEFMIKLSENPRSWARIQEILDQPDYQNSYNPKYNSHKGHDLQVPKHEVKLSKAAKALSRHPLPYHEDSVLEKQTPDPSSLLSRPLKEDNKIHMYWEKSHLKPQEKFHQQLLLDKMGNAASAYKSSPRKPSAYAKDNARPTKLHVPSVDLDPFETQQKHLQSPPTYPYEGPISAITIDVPTANNMRANKYSAANPKQAYIAVSVYKPSKDGNRYRTKGVVSKPNDSSFRYPNKLRPNSYLDEGDVAIERDPVTYIGTSTADRLAHSNSALQHLKNKDKMGDYVHRIYAKGKGKNKSRGRFGKQQTRKAKNRNKNRTKAAMDEIEAQLLTLSRMEHRLQQHMQQKEKLRQQMRLADPRAPLLRPSYI